MGTVRAEQFIGRANMPSIKILIAASSLAILAGCQMSADGERAAIGAGVGVVGAAALNGNLLTGAALGAAAGALCDDAGVCRR